MKVEIKKIAVYTVKNGDSLFGIAVSNKLFLPTLLKKNGIGFGRIEVGDILVL